MKNVLAILLFVFSLSAFAQNTQEELAMQYFHNKEYEKATTILYKLHKKNALNKYYGPLVSSYYFLERYKDAEKVIKRHIKKHPEHPELEVDLGFHYKKIGDEKKKKKIYDGVLKKISANTTVVLSIGNRFFQKLEYDYAIKAYLKGRKANNASYPYSFELVQVYQAKGNLTRMAKEAIGVLEYGSSYLDAVKGALSNVLEDDQNGKKRRVVKEELIKAVQSKSGNDSYAELLIWFYLQEKNFNGAFIHSKSLMKRNKERGNRMIELAKLCRQNKRYDVAVKCYKFVIKEQKKGYYYRRSKRELVVSLNEKINNDPKPKKEDLEALEKAYKETLKELGKTAFSIPLIRGYAHLKGFYFNQKDEAIKMLNEAIRIPRANGREIAACKLELGDIYVMHDEVWEAALLYGQVTKDFKHDIIGHEAKLKNAKAYFYSGEFEWAKAQLDVLKAATSKVISNDAIQLSVLISDNLALDTAVMPLKLYAKADLCFFQKKDSLALDYLDTVVARYPNHSSILDDAYFLKAKIFLKQQEYNKAIVELKNTINFKDLLEDDAWWVLGQLYEVRLGKMEEAKKCYEELLFNHTGSIYSVDARKRYRRLRGDSHQHSEGDIDQLDKFLKGP